MFSNKILLMKVRRRMKVYHPLPFREGSTLIRVYKEQFEDKIGNKAIITKADFKRNKKTHKGYTLYVKWL